MKQEPYDDKVDSTSESEMLGLLEDLQSKTSTLFILPFIEYGNCQIALIGKVMVVKGTMFEGWIWSSKHEASVYGLWARYTESLHYYQREK